ncbi:MAG: hypothetical protein WC156_13870 [Pedobacter sp.]
MEPVTTSVRDEDVVIVANDLGSSDEIPIERYSDAVMHANQPALANTWFRVSGDHPG